MKYSIEVRDISISKSCRVLQVAFRVEVDNQEDIKLVVGAIKYRYPAPCYEISVFRQLTDWISVNHE